MAEFAFLDGSAVDAAKRLLGCELVREIDGQQLIGRIVETEAYDQTDAASHSYRGRTPRTDVMFGPSGHLYVYFTYGMHYCMNIVCGGEGHGAAVLIRAVEPLAGEDSMVEKRGGKGGVDLTNGPAKLCYALAINKQWNGHDMREAPFQLVMKTALKPALIVQTTRIGISQAKDKRWRFYIAGNAYVSKV